MQIITKRPAEDTTHIHFTHDININKHFYQPSERYFCDKLLGNTKWCGNPRTEIF